MSETIKLFLTKMEVSVSVAESIANHIKYLPKGTPFTIDRFIEAGSRASVDKALSRLVQSGTLERVARGVYMRPKASPYVGKVRPSPTTVMMVIAKARGETIQVHGSEAVRLFRLSTQMQVRPTYYTSGTTRDIRVGDAVVHLRHVSPDKLQWAGTQVGLALCALFYIGKSKLTVVTAEAILARLSTAEISRLLSSRMPAWMREVLRNTQGMLHERLLPESSRNSPT